MYNRKQSSCTFHLIVCLIAVLITKLGQLASPLSPQCVNQTLADSFSYLVSDQDTILLSRLKAGDDKAFEILFKKYYKVLSVQAFYLLGDDMEAEDLVQRVFVAFWHDGRCHDIKTSIKAYLQKAVHNQSLNILEKRNRMKRSLDHYRSECIDTCSQPEFADDNGQQYLNAALRSLPVQQGEAFHLVHIEDKKYKEAAEAMGISVNSFKTHLKLAVKNLRARIKPK